ncbi:MAG: SulP family inorganic anion transporter [Phycisphaerae bacterium]|nr:SulP family inorganic anion transporter [Phycisphaerae bacterium]
MLPVAGWLRGYGWTTLRFDVLAGITLAAYLIPAGIGDASLARLPPEAGLYACVFGGLVFWIFCGSRWTAVTVTSAISLLIGTSLGEMAGGDTTRFAGLAAGTAVLVAVIAFVAWVFRAGSLVNFISETVLVGFKIGVALTLAVTQIPKLLGVSGTHGNFWHGAAHLIRHIGETNAVAAMTGGAALGVLLLGKRLAKNKPVALFVVAGGILSASILGLGERGVKLLGEVPRGLPPIGLTAVAWSDLNDLLPLAMACFLLGAVETTAIGRMFASKHGQRLDPNQELLAIAGSNLASGLASGYPVSGGMSQSLVNEGAGAKTPLSGLVAAVLMLVVVLFFSGILRDLPQPVLAAVVLTAVLGLVNTRAIGHLWRTDRQELLIAGAALAGVLASGLLKGVLIGAVISMALLIRRASRPHVAELGLIPGSRRYSDVDRHPDNVRQIGVLICRPESGVLYFNSEHIRESILERLQRSNPPPRLVVCDLSAVPIIDIAGAEMFMKLEADARAFGSRFAIVEARAHVRDKLRLEGMEARIGTIDRFRTVADVVDHFLEGDQSGIAGAPLTGAPLTGAAGRRAADEGALD